MAFHGCEQTVDDIGQQFPLETGYGAWAAANDFIVLYPQVKRSQLMGNPKGCFDWWGYTGLDYASRLGVQVRRIQCWKGSPCRKKCICHRFGVSRLLLLPYWTIIPGYLLVPFFHRSVSSSHMWLPAHSLQMAAVDRMVTSLASVDSMSKLGK